MLDKIEHFDWSQIYTVTHCHICLHILFGNLKKKPRDLFVLSGHGSRSSQQEYAGLY